MTRRSAIVAVLAVLAGAGWSYRAALPVQGQAAAPDVIYYNGKIVTVDDRFCVRAGRRDHRRQVHAPSGTNDDRSQARRARRPDRSI